MKIDPAALAEGLGGSSEAPKLRGAHRREVGRGDRRDDPVAAGPLEKFTGVRAARRWKSGGALSPMADGAV